MGGREGEGRGGGLGRDMQWDAYIPTCIVCSFNLYFKCPWRRFVFWRIVIMVKVAKFVLVDPL